MWGVPGTEEQGLEIRMKIVEVGRSEARSSRGQDLGIRVKVRLGDQKWGSGLRVTERRVGPGNGGQGAEPGRPAGPGGAQAQAGAAPGGSAGARKGARGRKLT